MQKRNNKSNKKSSHTSRAAVIFWVAFFTVIICIFMINAQTIKRNFDIFITRLTTSPGFEELSFLDNEEELNNTDDTAIEEHPVVTFITEQRPQEETNPAAENTAQTVTQNEVQEQRPQERPNEQVQTTQRPNETPAVTAPAETRERNIYFTQISNDGQILHSRVTRRLPVSNSPLLDSLNAMLIGPSADELNRGLINLIPQNTRILLTTVRGNTAYISFSEDFLFNTFGVEGYIAQLRQIVFTVTEFPNVNDVQILIEGRRMDYIGDGIWIGSPISRQNF